MYVANAAATGGTGGNTIDSFSATGIHLNAFLNQNPSGVAISSSGNRYATTQGVSFTGINVFSPSGSLLTSFSANLGSTPGLAIDSTGDLLVGVLGNVIERFSPTGIDLGTFASVTGGATFITVDSNGDVYASNGIGDIVRFSSSGQQLGSYSLGSGVAEELAFDSAGDLYAAINAAGANTRIEKFSPTLTDLGAFVPGGILVQPEGIAFTPDGNLLVTDITAQGGIVREFSPTGAGLGTFASGLN